MPNKRHKDANKIWLDSPYGVYFTNLPDIQKFDAMG